MAKKALYTFRIVEPLDEGWVYELEGPGAPIRGWVRALDRASAERHLRRLCDTLSARARGETSRGTGTIIGEPAWTT